MLAKSTAYQNTKAIGDISEMMVMAALMRDGHTVLKPFGDNKRYDLVVDVEGSFKRVQVKTGMAANGSLQFHTVSSYVHRSGGRRGYSGEIEFFGIYFPPNGCCYLIPVEECPKLNMTLRLDKPANNQVKGVRWAEAYRIGV